MAKFLGICFFAVFFVSFGYSYAIEDEIQGGQDDLQTTELRRIFEGLAKRNDSPIAAGVDGKSEENLDFVSLTIVFQNQLQYCGGSLIHPEYVLTSASCVVDPIEGPASVVDATFQRMKPPKTITKADLIIHPSYGPGSPFFNIALVKLSEPVVPDDKTVALAVHDTNEDPDYFFGRTVRACGFGSIGTRSKNLRCTDLNIVSIDDCEGDDNFTVPPGGPPPPPISTKWNDRENNTCDYGGPLYVYSFGADKKIVQKVVGIAAQSFNFRRQASCLGGRTILHTPILPFIEWIGSSTGVN